MEKSKKYIILGLIVFIIILFILVVLITTGILKNPFQAFTQKKVIEATPKIIQEDLVIPETTSIAGGEAKIVPSGLVEVPLVPKDNSEKVIVPKAVLTVKGAYSLTLNEAKKLAGDVMLSFIKSLGAVNIDGKSSQWQVVFSSKEKGKAYEFIVQGEQIVKSGEFTSGAFGAQLPANWYDSDGAIKTLQFTPEFSSATVSAINFYFDLDSQGWMYALSTSLGVTSMTVK
jgi:hypothetical protein